MFFLAPATAGAKFFVRPIFGLTVPITGGDSAWAAGAALGYGFTNSLSVETSYTRLIAMDNGFDNNLIQFTGTYSFFLPGITPFIRGGGGFYKMSVPGTDTDFEGMIEIGGGIVLTFIPVLDIGAGLSYLIMLDSKDLIFPNLYVGLSF